MSALPPTPCAAAGVRVPLSRAKAMTRTVCCPRCTRRVRVQVENVETVAGQSGVIPAHDERNDLGY